MNPVTPSPLSAARVLRRLDTIRTRASTGLCAALAAMVSWAATRSTRHERAGVRPAGQAGQSTVEYALILLGAAAVALVVVAWVTRTDLIGRLFDTVVGRILQQAS